MATPTRPFFAAEPFPLRTSRPSCIAWADGHLPAQVEVFALCHLLDLTDTRAAPAQPVPAGRKKAKLSRATSASEAAGEANRPGPPPLVMMLLVQSMRFGCGRCLRLLATVGGKQPTESKCAPDDIHFECLHYMCARQHDAESRADSIWQALATRRRTALPSVLTLVSHTPAQCTAPFLTAWSQHFNDSWWGAVADSTAVLVALLDHAAKHGKIPKTLFRCVLKGGNLEFMRIVLRRGLFDREILLTGELAHAAEQRWPVSDGMRELLAQYLK